MSQIVRFFFFSSCTQMPSRRNFDLILTQSLSILFKHVAYCFQFSFDTVSALGGFPLFNSKSGLFGWKVFEVIYTMHVVRRVECDRAVRSVLSPAGGNRFCENESKVD